jgi:hypothetical protein
MKGRKRHPPKSQSWAYVVNPSPITWSKSHKELFKFKIFPVKTNLANKNIRMKLGVIFFFRNFFVEIQDFLKKWLLKNQDGENWVSFYFHPFPPTNKLLLIIPLRSCVLDLCHFLDRIIWHSLPLLIYTRIIVIKFVLNISFFFQIVEFATPDPNVREWSHPCSHNGFSWSLPQHNRQQLDHYHN